VRVCQLIKLGLSTIVQSACSMPVPLVSGMAATATPEPERHRLDI
jgi:hypothetical protein